MNRMWTSSLALAGVLLLGSVATARADTETLMVVNVPFSFVAEGKTLPAGRYLVEREDITSSVLLLEGEHGQRTSRFVATIPAGGLDPRGDVPVLTFAREGNHMRLSGVWQSRTEGEKVVG